LNKDIKNLIADSFSTCVVLTASSQAQTRQLINTIWSQREQRSTIYCLSNIATRINLVVKVVNIATVRTTIKV